MAGFAQAIEESMELLQAVEHGGKSEDQAQDQVLKLLGSMEDGRGFFVALLTGPSGIADKPPDWLIAAFNARLGLVAELLAKNLAMSTATQLTHERKGDAQAAAGSATVARRADLIIKRLSAEPMRQALRELDDAIVHRLDGSKNAGAVADSTWGSFLERWGYDQEQLNAIKNALLLAAAKTPQAGHLEH